MVEDYEFDKLLKIVQNLIVTVEHDGNKIKQLETDLEYFKTRLNYLVNKEKYD